MNLKDILYQVNNLPRDGFEAYWELWHKDPEFLEALKDHLKLYSLPEGFKKRVEGYGEFPKSFQEVVWAEDSDKYYYGGEIIHLYPELAGLYAKAVTGGYETEVGNKLFKHDPGYRGIDIPSIIAFDSSGRGCLFIKK